MMLAKPIIKSVPLLGALMMGACLAMAGCGLRPVYRESGTEMAQGFGIGRVSIAAIDGRLGFLLGRELENHNRREPVRAGAPPLLNVSVDTQYLDAAFRQDSYADRIILIVSADWSLNIGQESPLRGHVSVRDSYDSRDRSFAAVNLQSTAEENLSRDLARAIWLDIATKVRQ